MLISVIVATYNRAHLLQSSIESLLKLETKNIFSFEVIVVDNCSTDHTKTVIDELHEKNKRIPIKYYSEKKPGVAYARNKGLKKAKGDWVAFFDDDQIADHAWLTKLVDVALTNNIDCIGGRIKLLLPRQDDSLPQVCRAILGSLNFGSKSKRLPKKCLPGTGSVLIKRKLFESIGIFDETFTRGAEDADLFRRIEKAGYELWYAPESIAYHVIPEYRLRNDYFIWCSLRDGVNYAYLDHKENGSLMMVWACILRVGQAVAVTMPKLCVAWLRQEDGVKLDQKCLLSKASGYFRETLFILAPKLFRQDSFFHRLDFRGERETFKKIES